MPQVGSENIEQVRQEVDAEEDFGRAVEGPVEQFDQGHQPVGLEHVVAVFAKAAKLLDDLDYEAESFAEVF